ncbi:DUF998 domain-containing protein [Paractinoplanes toevensis]|uniref:DUF998 domain-containing protein n=1 Tax=Paractinoplanes toevensis TaxID=571911 RepID=UPI0034DB235F
MIVFVAVAGALRPGYDANRHWISQLSLGPGGWAGALNLATVGIWLFLAGLGLRSQVSRWGFRLLLGCGVDLVLIALFRTDAGIGYPPGLPAEHSLHGLVHKVLSLGLAGAGIGGVIALRTALPFRRSPVAGLVTAALMAVAFAAGAVLVSLDANGVLSGSPSGLFERVALFAGLGWIGAVSGWAAWGSSGRRPAAASPTDRPEPARTAGVARDAARDGAGP